LAEVVKDVNKVYRRVAASSRQQAGDENRECDITMNGQTTCA